MIRKYRNDDLEELLSVWKSASELAHPFLSKEFLALERSTIAEKHLPVVETWVYENEGRILGFVSLLGNEVGAIFVDPEHQRRGIGGRLMDKARELHGELELEVFKANGIGRAFYAKYGFEAIGERVDEEAGHEVLRLRLALSSAGSAA